MAPPFYMYDSPALDHSWMESCPAFRALRHSTASEKLAEAGVHASLATHPSRVADPARARVFVVGVFEFASFMLGHIANCTSDRPGVAALAELEHPERMHRAAAALVASPHWQRCSGCDHVFASSATDAPRFRIRDRLGGQLGAALACATGPHTDSTCALRHCHPNEAPSIA